MTIRQIERIKEEMIADLKLKLSLQDGYYDFYIRHDKERAYTHAHEAFLLFRKIERIKAIDISLLDLDTLLRIEEYITLLRKENYFEEDEIDAFVKICR